MLETSAGAMKPIRVISLFCLFWAAMTATPPAWAQLGPRDPHIGYFFPSGGKAGTTVEITVGGEFLEGVTGVHCLGGGVRATVGKYHRPLNQGEAARLRQKLEDARERMKADGKAGGPGMGPMGYREMFRKVATEAGVSTEQLMALEEFRKAREDPKKQINPAIAETVTFKIDLAPDAAPGVRELRLIGPNGLSNPLAFHVGELAEIRETEPNNKGTGTLVQQALPVVLNGQILPGDVDRFSFQGRKGQRLVVVASARELVPHLADAVPGWFQATLALYDAKGNEVSYADDYHFDPDPVLACEIPEDGSYVLEVRDAIFRGREDFVYRITLGEIPFVTGIFPMGGPAGAPTSVELIGWNLPFDRMTVEAGENRPGIRPISVGAEQRISHAARFAVDTLPECLEAEPNNEPKTAQPIALPVIVNGRIERPGDQDVFAFESRSGGEIAVEVVARRLNSPMDSMLKLTDAHGRQLGVNDDYEDPASPLVTHHADSLLRVRIPAAGTYYLHLGDTQRKGGAAFAYRLHVNVQHPDFALRVVPSSVNVRAGATVPITVHVLRKDGFEGDIALALKEAPPGFRLSGCRVPAGQEKVRLTLTAPATPMEGPVRLAMDGRATIGGREVSHPAVPAEDMMQAFAYHHLVPAQEWLVDVMNRGAGFQGATRPQAAGRFARFQPPGGGPAAAARAVPLPVEKPVKLTAGGTARVQMPSPLAAFLAGELKIELSDPPEGITIKECSSAREGVDILLSAEPGKVKPGLKGNLIFDAFIERVPPSPDGKARTNKFRVSLGVLPAVPFEIVQR